MSPDNSEETRRMHFGGDPELTYTEISAEFAEWERTEQQAKAILAATAEQLGDPEWLLERIRQAGLFPFVHGADSYLAEHVHQLKTVQGVNQYPSELIEFWRILRQEKVRTFLEIGTLGGNTCVLTAAYIQRYWELDDIPKVLGQVPRITTIDVEPHFFFYGHVKDWLPIDYLFGNSFCQIGQTYDAVLIDGDHTARWAMADWQNVGWRARVCAFHDIASRDYAARRYGGAPGVWNHVKHVSAAPRISFTEICHHPLRDRWGIGVRIFR